MGHYYEMRSSFPLPPALFCSGRLDGEDDGGCERSDVVDKESGRAVRMGIGDSIPEGEMGVIISAGIVLAVVAVVVTAAVLLVGSCRKSV